MDTIDFGRFEELSGFTFHNKELLHKAFTHRSFLNENKGHGEHNERLEFLGDAVLELVVTDFLFNTFPEKTEGELTAFRSALVNTITLSQVATEMGMNDYLLLSRGEAKDTGRARQYILADTFEAFVGALYIDQHYEQAQQFIAKFLFPKLDEVIEKRLWQDAKSNFQEQAQEKESTTPVYKTMKEIGPDHDKKFVVGVLLGDDVVAEGEGLSKQEAEQEAAQRALEEKGW